MPARTIKLGNEDITIIGQIMIALASFVVMAAAAHQLGKFLTSFIRLPLISGYLITGVIVGPFILGMLTTESIESIRFLDEISLSFIAFAAGSELYLKELKSRLRSILAHSIGQVLAIFILGSVGIYLLTSFIPFAQNLPTSARVAVAILAAAILVARSPSSAIAIVNELRARGTFTKTLIGVTVVMDVIVVVLFAITAAVAGLILTGESFSPIFILLLAFELLISVALGYIIGKLIDLILATHLQPLFKTACVLLIGYGVFILSRLVRGFTHENLPFEILLEPLLICMVAAFVVTNYSRFRDEFLELLHDTGPFIYVIFFTLVGITLRLDVLLQGFVIAVAIFALRLLGLILGSFIGGSLVGDPTKHIRVAGFAYVTQAGIGLGLAREIAIEFPQLGDEFATLVISVIVLSQFVGPPLLKFAIKRVGESHLPGQFSTDKIRNVLILGIEGQSWALARQLQAHQWKVMLADTHPPENSSLEEQNIEFRVISEIAHTELKPLLTNTDAVVMMMSDDSANLKACELAYERFGITRLIVRLNSVSWAEKFKPYEVHIVYPASAMVSLLDRYVRAPQSTALIMDEDPEHEVVQITVTDRDIDGLLLRELRLPSDVLVLDIRRDGIAIVPEGHSALRLNDEVTLIGKVSSLAEVTRRFGY